MGKQTDYIKSNSVLDVHYNRFSHRYYRRFLSCGETCKERTDKAQGVLDYLCKKYELPKMRVGILDRPQPKSGRTTFEAFYYYRGHYVKMFNHTPRGKVVPIERMAVTLLHEFMHHYDRYYLGIESTPHTRGFFSRIRNLRRKLQ